MAFLKVRLCSVLFSGKKKNGTHSYSDGKWGVWYSSLPEDGGRNRFETQQRSAVEARQPPCFKALGLLLDWGAILRGQTAGSGRGGVSHRHPPLTEETLVNISDLKTGKPQECLGRVSVSALQPERGSLHATDRGMGGVSPGPGPHGKLKRLKISFRWWILVTVYKKQQPYHVARRWEEGFCIGSTVYRVNYRKIEE